MPEKTRNRLSFVINVVFVAVVAALVYLALKYVIGWVLPFLLAFLIVSLVHPLIRLIKKNLKIKQEIVSILVMVLIYALVGVLAFLLVLQLVVLIRDGFTVLPGYFNETMLPALNKAGDSLMNYFNQLPPQWQEQITSIQGDLIKTLQSFLLDLSQKGINIVSRLTSSVPSFLIGFVFTIMLSFFISMQYDKVLDFFRVQFSARAKAIVRDLRTIVIETIFKYIKAALTLMGITFVELSIGLLLLRTANAIPIALGIAVFDALPFFGTGAIVIPWALIELLQGHYQFALGLALLYAVITVIRNLIEPKIVGDKLGLNPIVSLTAIYLGFKLFGVLGMIIMPICTQIGMELHRSGTIRLFKETVAQEPEAAPPTPEAAPPTPEAAPPTPEDTPPANE